LRSQSLEKFGPGDIIILEYLARPIRVLGHLNFVQPSNMIGALRRKIRLAKEKQIHLPNQNVRKLNTINNLGDNHHLNY